MKKAAAKSKTKMVAPIDENTDIVELILEDHKPLKKNIKILKNPDIEMKQRQASFAEFAPLLLQHAEPEEKALYTYMKDENEEMRVDGFEGQEEHAIASQLVEEINKTKDPDQWTARVKVLAEAVEHHIEEEETDVLKLIKKEVDKETRAELGQKYLKLREDFVQTHSRMMKTAKLSEMRTH